MVAVEGEVFEQLAALPVRAARHIASVDREHVKHDQHHFDAPLAVKHPIAQPREAWQAVVTEADEFAVNCEAVRQAGEFGDEAGHVPAAATPDAEVTVSRRERAEAVPLGFKGIVAAGRQSARAKEQSSVTVNLGGTYKTVSGSSLGSVTLANGNGAVLVSG